MAVIYRKINVKVEARANINKAVELNPNDIIIRKERALFNIENNDYVAAIFDFEKLK
jgi:Flp pilus assembly protein TadD